MIFARSLRSCKKSYKWFPRPVVGCPKCAAFYTTHPITTPRMLALFYLRNTHKNSGFWRILSWHTPPPTPLPPLPHPHLPPTMTSGNILANGNLCFRVFKPQLKELNKNVCYFNNLWLRGCSYEVSWPGYVGWLGRWGDFHPASIWNFLSHCKKLVASLWKDCFDHVAFRREILYFQYGFQQFY